MNQETHEKYNLLTAMTIIVGVCIGSGIFFKSDNILIATKGSIPLGVLLFVLAAIAIVFGSLTVGELAARTNKVGGIVTYAEEFINKQIACGFGWFQTFVYFPTITVVVAWVVGIYVDILFAFNATLEFQMLMGFIFLVLCFLYNVLIPRFGSLFQDVSTFVKLVPLFLLGVLGMIYGDPLTGLSQTQPETILGASWLTALRPIAYSYDGWIVSTSIAHEVKNSKQTMPKALTIAPLIVLFIYTLYFVGISSYVGPHEVIQLGDTHVSVAAKQLLGTTFSQLMTVFIIVSVMGTVNGLVTGFIRMPYSLALRDHMIPFSHILRKVHKRLDMPVYSAIFSFMICIIWFIIHYFTTKLSLLDHSDVSEIAIAIAYLLYIALYYQVFKLYQKKIITSVFKGIICPLLATIGSLIILSGALQNRLIIFYILFCLLVYMCSQWYFQKHQN